MQKRRKYSEEYIREAVALTNQSGATLKEIGEELGINPGMIGRWRRELGLGESNAFAGQGKPRDEEMATLKRELAKVKKERDFLREAAVDSIGQCNTSCFNDEFGVNNGTTRATRVIP